jgi:hypothetical protein
MASNDYPSLEPGSNREALRVLAMHPVGAHYSNVNRIGPNGSYLHWRNADWLISQGWAIQFRDWQHNWRLALTWRGASACTHYGIGVWVGERS